MEKEQNSKEKEKFTARESPSEISPNKEGDPYKTKNWLTKIRDAYRNFFKTQEVEEKQEKDVISKMNEEIQQVEKESIRNGVDFSRCQINDLLEAYHRGDKVEVESFSPYATDYNLATGEIGRDKLIPEDQTGLAIAGMLRQEFPNARLISLYDEYNTGMPDTENISNNVAPINIDEKHTNKKPTPKSKWMLKGAPYKEKIDPETGEKIKAKQIVLPKEVQTKFKEEVKSVLMENGAIKEGDKENKNFLLVSESSKQVDAEQLVEILHQKGLLKQGEGGSLYFSNPDAENPEFREIELRTDHGHWMCEALDASTYLKPENQEIAHLVILPDHFKKQQDKVWEILRVLGIQPENYHNIFFDPKTDTDTVVQTIKEEIDKYE